MVRKDFQINLRVVGKFLDIHGCLEQAPLEDDSFIPPDAQTPAKAERIRLSAILRPTLVTVWGLADGFMDLSVLFLQTKVLPHNARSTVKPDCFSCINSMLSWKGSESHQSVRGEFHESLIARILVEDGPRHAVVFPQFLWVLNADVTSEMNFVNNGQEYLESLE